MRKTLLGTWGRLLLALLLLGQAPLSRGAALNGYKAFVVRRLSGTVLSRRPNSVKWREVAVGMQLGEGDLIQVTDGAAISLRFAEGVHNDLGGLKAAQAFVNIDRPMIVRLEANLLRKARLETFFLNGLPTMAGSQPATPVEAKMSIEEAWHRVSAMFSSTTKQNNGEQKASGDVTHQGMALSVSAKSIEMMSPLNNGVIFGRKLPVEVHIAWHEVADKNASYFLYVWEVDKARSDPVAVTKQNFHTHLFMHYGSYQMQVSTTNEHYQSTVMLVHIVPPAFDAAAEKKRLEAAKLLTANAEEEHLIQQNYPPKNTTLVLKDANAMVNFYWHAEKDLVVDHYQLIVKTVDGHPVQSVRTTTPTSQLSLGRGTFLWRVEAFTSDEATPKPKQGGKIPKAVAPTALATSTEHAVTIIDMTQNLDSRTFVRNFLLSGAHGTLDLSSGL